MNNLATPIYSYELTDRCTAAIVFHKYLILAINTKGGNYIETFELSSPFFDHPLRLINRVKMQYGQAVSKIIRIKSFFMFCARNYLE